MRNFCVAEVLISLYIVKFRDFNWYRMLQEHLVYPTERDRNFLLLF